MKNKQTILIAGATGSIGGAAALALVKRGARVVLLGRKPDKSTNDRDMGKRLWEKLETMTQGMY